MKITEEVISGKRCFQVKYNLVSRSDSEKVDFVFSLLNIVLWVNCKNNPTAGQSYNFFV